MKNLIFGLLLWLAALILLRAPWVVELLAGFLLAGAVVNVVSGVWGIITDRV